MLSGYSAASEMFSVMTSSCCNAEPTIGEIVAWKIEAFCRLLSAGAPNNFRRISGTWIHAHRGSSVKFQTHGPAACRPGRHPKSTPALASRQPIPTRKATHNGLALSRLTADVADY
jgi:hypothetical protein